MASQLSLLTASGLRSRVLPGAGPDSCHTDSRTMLTHGAEPPVAVARGAHLVRVEQFLTAAVVMRPLPLRVLS
jgi:hypothetical protein